MDLPAFGSFRITLSTSTAEKNATLVGRFDMPSLEQNSRSISESDQGIDERSY